MNTADSYALFIAAYNEGKSIQGTIASVIPRTI